MGTFPLGPLHFWDDAAGGGIWIVEPLTGLEEFALVVTGLVMGLSVGVGREGVVRVGGTGRAVGFEIGFHVGFEVALVVALVVGFAVGLDGGAAVVF